MRFIPFPELTEEDLRAWERLAGRAAQPNPFFEPGFAAIAAKTLGAAGAGLLTAEADGGGWTGCVPVRPLAGRAPRFALGTWSHEYSFLGTPLVDRDRLDRFAADLVAAVARRETGHLLFLRDIDEGPVLAALRAAIGASDRVGIAYERSFERAAVERRPEPDFESALKSSRRRGLSRRRRKLAEVVDGDLHFRYVRCEDGAVETFLELEASGWKGEEGTAMACNAGSAAFFAQMCEWFDQRERLHMRIMQGNEKTIVMICNVAAGNALFSFKTAFDESFRKYAPGLLLQIDDFNAWHARQREDYMDSCGDPNAHTLNEFWPDRRTITTVVIGRRGLTASAVRAALRLRYAPAGRRLAAMIRRPSTRLGLAAGFLAHHQQLFELGGQYALRI
jgi:GNAT acetyltransferase-like protein